MKGITAELVTYSQVDIAGLMEQNQRFAKSRQHRSVRCFACNSAGCVAKLFPNFLLIIRDHGKASSAWNEWQCHYHSVSRAVNRASHPSPLPKALASSDATPPPVIARDRHAYMSIKVAVVEYRFCYLLA